MLDLSKLNPPQREAVLHGAGPLVVFAGAGSGKTRVITYRIAHLIEEGGVFPERILAVTFTNKAAGEMRERLAQLLPGRPSPWVGTFHAICARLLRRHAELLGLPPSFVIYDDTDQRAMLTRILRELDLDDRRFSPRDMARFIESMKQRLMLPAEFHPRDSYEEQARRVYELYEERMRQCGALDFNDLLGRVVLGLRSSEPFAFKLTRQWEYVLVDEFQDTNVVQLELVQRICERHRNLCVVGDDDQSIYKWRGAERRNILDFQKAFADAKVVKLEQNYRSSKHILGAATAVIARNEDREPKTLFTENPPGEKVRVVGCTDERDEARAISTAVRSLRDHGMKLADMAVFYRTHAQSRVLEEEMRASNFQYRVVGGQRFYERAEVKDLLCYLRVLVQPDDDVSMLRIINTPARGIGKTTTDRLLERAASTGKSVWNVLSQDDLAELGAKAAQTKLAAFVRLIRELSAEAARGTGPGEIALAILDRTGYVASLRSEDSVEADARIENVQELVASINEFEREAESPTLSSYLEVVTLQSNTDDIDGADKLTLMTVHAAKGLEYPAVWVAGLEERMFPLSRDGSLSSEDLEEERRLAYVAFTRAEQRLFLSYAAARRIHGDFMVGIPSRFLDEIPREHVERVERGGGRGATGSFLGQRYGAPSPVRSTTPDVPGGARYEYDSEPSADRSARIPVPAARPGVPPRVPAPKGALARPTPAFAPIGVKRPGAPSRSPGESYVDRSESDEGGGSGMSRGMRVRHAKYGEGEVLEVQAGTPVRVSVRFTGWGVKQIAAPYLEPAF
jgi:DNA helicase II / ATP-dependent DNA helicase PcrA